MSNLHGQTVRGYRLNEIAGAGGFGTVYHAQQEVLNREVAVKVINEKYVNKPQFIRQFEAEARIIARLEHLHIVTLYDYWRDPTGAYLIMRWLKGGSLRDYLKRNKMTLPQIVRLLNQIASALAFGHQLNVIHRDIKPENILLDGNGNAFLTDFGIAVDLRNQENLDIENISFGSPDYVAPEQLTEKLITPKVDIYSLGIMLYELLAYERPFRADTAKEIMQMQLRNPVPSLRLTRPDLPTEIDTIIWQATAKRPASRYDSVLELAVAFQNIATSVADVPQEYNIATEKRQVRRQNLPIKRLSGDTIATGVIDLSATGKLDAIETGILDVSETNELDAMGTDILDPSATGVLDLPDEDDPAVIGVLDDTEQSGIMATGRLDNLATGIMPSDNAIQELDILATNLLENIAAEPDLDEKQQKQEPETFMTVEIVGEGSPNPYKGLSAFEEGDTDTFFGRETIIKQLLEQFADPKKRFLALIGPSGSGKSSIIRAGIIPQFRKGAVLDSRQWFISIMIPSSDPFREMSEALLRVSISAPENWGEMLRKSIQGLHNLLGMILPEDNSQLLLFIDQFEEVFTLYDDDKQREMFLGSLWYALNQPNSHLRLIITLRADFYDRPLHYAQFGELLKQNTEVVLPLNLQELGAAILGPANKVGLQIEQLLTNTLLEEIHNQPGALPLLQYTLTELYERRDREKHELRYEDYLMLGGISGALAQRAQEIYFSRLNEIEQSLAQQLFLRLVAIDENGKATRRRAIWQELMQGVEQEELENVINAFSRHRLLTTDRDPVTRTPTIEVAHEALINAWGELRKWIDDNRYALQKRQEIRIEVDRWLTNNRETSYLASGLRLAEFENLQGNQLFALREEELEYIEAGVFERETELRRTQRINQVLQIFSAIVGVLAIIAVVLFINASLARQEAETQRDIAEQNAKTAQSREIAAVALSLNRENDLSLLLSLEAYDTTPTYEALNSLLVGLQQYPFIQTYLQGHSSGVRAIDYNSDGKIALSAGADGLIIRWDMSNQQMIGEPLQGHTATINAVAFSPDDSLIASASDDMTIRFWNAQTGEELAILENHDAKIWSLDFSSDGQYLASSDEAGTIIIWDVNTHEALHIIENAHDGIIFKVIFNANGTTLASGGGDNIVRLWDTTTGEIIGDPLIGHNNWVRALIFHPQQPNFLISADLDSNLIFWDINIGQALAAPFPTGHEQGIYDLAFHPIFGILATAGWGGDIRLWDLKTNQFLGRLSGHQGIVWSVDFLPIDDRIVLVSGSEDGDALVWNYTAVQRPSQGVALSPGLILDHFVYHEQSALIAVVGQDQSDRLPSLQIWKGTGTAAQQVQNILLNMISPPNDNGTIPLPSITDLAFSPDGTRLALLATTPGNGVVLVWDTGTGELLWSKSVYEGITKSLAFLNDGSQIITSDIRGTILFWDTETGEQIAHNFSNRDTGDITAMALSPDGQILALNIREQGVSLWDLQTVERIDETLNGHSGVVNVLHFDHSGDILYSASVNGTVISWDVATGKQLEVFQAQNQEILSLAISPDNTLMVSGYVNGDIRLWDTASGRTIGNVIHSLEGRITSLFFTGERTILGSNRENRVVLQWSVDVNNWLQQACIIANRSLTEAEWEQFLPPELAYKPNCSP
jgi:WD40 repeat protein/serine/threonine protein kinase